MVCVLCDLSECCRKYSYLSAIHPLKKIVSCSSSRFAPYSFYERAKKLKPKLPHAPWACWGGALVPPSLHGGTLEFHPHPAILRLKIWIFGMKWSKIPNLALSAYCMPTNRANELNFEHIKCVQPCYSRAEFHSNQPIDC